MPLRARAELSELKTLSGFRDRLRERIPRRGWPRFAGLSLLKPRGARSLRSHIFLIVIIAFIPLLLFSAATVVLIARESRDTVRDGAMERTLALLTAVDTEVKRAVAALEALATSDRLDARALDLFRGDAERVLLSRPEWLTIHLAPPTGRQVLNLLGPPGNALHDVVETDSFREVVDSGRPVVGALFEEPHTRQHVFPVRVPVTREGEVRYVLTALVRPEAIDALLSPQGLPPNWVGGVLDAGDTIVARTVKKELVGQPASESLRAALARDSQGWIRGSTIEGWPVYAPFHRSSFSGWSVAIGIPRSEVDAPLRRSLLYLGAFGLLVLGASIALAWLLSRHSVRSLEALAGMAEDLGQERQPAAESLPANILEVQNIRGAFVKAAELIRARSDERDRVESSLRKVENELRQSEQRKDRFLAMLGHELRNPLSVIGTAVELLRRLSTDDATAEPRAMIERQVAHIKRLLDDLLDVTRIAQGRIEVVRKPCDLTAIVRQTVEDHRQNIESSGLSLVLQIPEHPICVMGDAVRLAQAVGNLLQNANKYSNAGGTVTVRLHEDPDRDSAILTVRDTGVGMEPEILMHAFDAFSQADRTIARSRGGLGLGLALVKGLVELHGGTVRASSEGMNRGAEVTVELPTEAADQVPVLTPARSPVMPRRSRRVLVIEDNPMAARSMQLYLTGLGHEVEVINSGSEGVEMANRTLPDVVLCDIGLPGIDGYQVAQTLRRRHNSAHFKLIAISGYGQDADRRLARQAGFDDHLTKPVDLDRLRDIIAG